MICNGSRPGQDVRPLRLTSLSVYLQAMPNRSKQKGDRAERAIVELLRSFGLDAYRVPLSGAVNGFKDDIEIRHGDKTLRLESKVRSKGFRNIYRWKADSDCLVIKADNQEPLAVVSLARLAKLISASNSVSPSPHLTPSEDSPTQEPLIENKPIQRVVFLQAGPPSIAVPKD